MYAVSKSFPKANCKVSAAYIICYSIVKPRGKASLISTGFAITASCFVRWIESECLFIFLFTQFCVSHSRVFLS